MKQLLALLLATSLNGATIINGGFETGDLTGWTFAGETSTSYQSKVEGGQFSTSTAWSNQFGFFTPEQMEGNYSFFSGFDGRVQEITLSQNIGIIDVFTQAVAFDVRAGWDLKTYKTQSGYEVIEDREIKVIIIDNDTGETLLSQSLFNAVGETIQLDSGFQTVGIGFEELVGKDVTMSFVQNIPQNFTGPALIQLDNIRLQAVAIPEPSTFLFLCYSLAAIFLLRRRA